MFQRQHGFARGDEHAVAASPGNEPHLGIGLALVGLKVKRQLAVLFVDFKLVCGVGLRLVVAGCRAFH